MSRPWGVALGALLAAAPAAAGPLPGLGDSAEATLRLVASHRSQRLSLGALNPDNRALNLPSRTSEGEARLDLTLAVGPFDVTAKPRGRVTRDAWSDGRRAGEAEGETDALLLGGVVRGRLGDRLFGSFGRETLQWGPGQLVNPANPFFAENGRENPLREIPGLDFARAVWLVGDGITLSWLTNTGVGEGTPLNTPWQPSHALQVEVTGQEASGGAVLHGGRGRPPSAAAFGQWTASDALLAYGEVRVSRGTEGRYPGPTGVAASREEDGRLYPFALLGASYTLEGGTALSLEYAYHRDGYDRGEAGRFFDLAHARADLVARGLAPPGDPDDTLGLRLLRRHYLFGQVLRAELWDRLTLVLRWTQNLDDRSGLATGYAEWNLADRWRLFGFGAGGTGGNRAEFGSAVRAVGLVGVEVTAY